MQRMIRCALAFAMLVAIGGCAGEDAPRPQQPAVAQVKQAQGTGIILDSLTGLTLPILNIPLGTIVIDQVILTDLILVEDVVGNIVGLEATGTIVGTVDVLGTQEVVSENFTTEARVASSGFGQCEIITIDLAPINIDLLSGAVADVDLPAAAVQARGSGALGPLLCALGQFLEVPVQDVVVPVVRALIRAIDTLLL